MGELTRTRSKQLKLLLACVITSSQFAYAEQATETINLGKIVVTGNREGESVNFSAKMHQIS